MSGEVVHGVSPRAPGVRAIVLYKIGKSAGEALLAIVVMVLVLTGYVTRAHELATALREHLVHHWSVKLAELLMSSLTAKRLWWIVAALIGDAIVSGIEGYALGRGYGWAAWFVVAATSLLLPVEVIELSHRTTLGRVLLFLINMAIVIYLLKRAMKEHHERHPHARRA
ncbi:MAG TPA: DUF2127 domain-containing protein [Polyangia bacterium]|jgi:uncharacterized membrane protein (DUF2068 family)